MESALSVVQLNAGSLLEPNWRERRHEVLAWLDRLDADIVCLQEIWQDNQHQNTAEWLVEQRRGRWFWCFGGLAVPPAFGADESLRFGSAILSRWPIDEHELFVLPGTDPTSDNPFDAVELELLAGRTAGIDVFSTHLFPMPQRASVRRSQVLFIDQRVTAWRNPNSPLPPVLCGDFNAEPESDEIRFLCGLTSIDGHDTWWQEAWRAAGQVDPGYTQHPVNPYYATFNLPPKRIDYVFIGDTWLTKQTANEAGDQHPTTRGRVLSADLAFHEPITPTLASDHFGLIITVGWPDRPDVELHST